MNINRPILIFLIAAVVVTSVAQAKETETHWGYEGESANWAILNHEWSICTKGLRQSPIDIEKTMRADAPEMKSNFEHAKLNIIHHTHTADAINNGHTVQVNYTDGDTLTIGKEQFQLVQYHFHSPSEHTIHGKHFPMEMHLVHQSAEGKLAVIGVFIETGNHNAAFDPIWSKLPKSKGEKNHFDNVTVDVSSLLPTTTTIYRYDGSLTTPPCSEGVKWIVMDSPIQLSDKQIETFQTIIKGNNRPVQPQNDRPVVTDSFEESEMK